MSKHAIIVTGAGSGIGEATAQLFSKNGFPVVLVGRHREKLDRVSGTLKSPFLVLPCDVRRTQEVEWMVKEAIKEIGPIECVVNNAGAFERKSFQETTDSDWTNQLESNLLGTVRVTRALIPHFEKRGGGCVINVSSTLGIGPVPMTAPYSASKAALINLTHCLALELAPQKIRVNAVAFGIIETPILGLAKLSNSEASSLREQMHKMHPLGRMGTVEEAAWAIYQFAVPEAAWTTGAVLTVDGGINLA